MGGLFSCCLDGNKDESSPSGGADTYHTFPGGGRGGGGPQQPDPEERRRQLAEAAEKRKQSQEHRGIKDPESVKRQQRRQEEMERLEKDAILRGDSGGGLKWQVS